MGSLRRKYSIGDWVVHCCHGVGQITAIEERPLYDGNNCRKRCYKVKTSKGEYWFPIDNNDNTRIRSVASPNKLKLVLRRLGYPPQDIDAQKAELKKRISKVRSDVSLVPMICLVRDLFARNQVKNLGVDEDRALNKFTEHLITEYAVSMEIDIGLAKSQLFSMLRERDRKYNQKFFFGLGNSS